VLYKFDRVRDGTGLAGELGSPGAEFGVIEPSELVRFRHGVPQGEGALEVAEGFGEAEHIPCLAGRVDRSDERLSPSGSTANWPPSPAASTPERARRHSAGTP
jgi:hypothetical protein